MSWNYRVVRKAYEKETVLGIHEVYYNDKGIPSMVTVDAMDVEVTDVEGLHILRGVLGMMLKATDKPILEYSDIGEDSD